MYLIDDWMIGFVLPHFLHTLYTLPKPFGHLYPPPPPPHYSLFQITDDEQLNTIRSERGYNYQDMVTVSPEKLPNYEEKVGIRHRPY